MNYRHRFHAGNFADVFKHVLLMALIRSLQRKDKGFLYLDTHAGLGRYDLTEAARGDTLERKPEHPDGIGRLWNRDDLPPALADFVALVKRFNLEQGGPPDALKFYPGSPWIARLLAREQDRLALCELHPEDSRELENEFAHVSRTRVHTMDGYTGLKAMLPPPERRALTLIDPAFESKTEFEQILDGLEAALHRFPGGVFAIWYPLTDRVDSAAFHDALRSDEATPALFAELAITGEHTELKMRGCGVAVLNPPWQFAEEIAPLLPVMARLLQQEPVAASRLEWLVRER